MIPTKGHWDYCRKAIGSAALTPAAAVVVIDDASTRWPGEGVIANWANLGGVQSPCIIQRYSTEAGLTRSWNAGLRIARELGCPFAVVANSDLIFAPGWFTSIRRTLENGIDFAGPVTNAPGHAKRQDVAAYLPGCPVSDDPQAIYDVQDQLRILANMNEERALLNGFCIAGKTEQFFRAANDPANPFDPRIPLAGNEDDFFKRVLSFGLRCSIVPTSYVFHYRSVTRSYDPKRLDLSGLDKGAFRMPTCGPCEAKGN